MACACPSHLCPVAAMRRAMQVARSVNIAHGRPAGLGPLFPRRDGKYLTKKNVVGFYNALAELVRCTGRMTGHSARVTGAMRMAYAHLSEWTIQMFGRWGSTTVLRYVREALLGRAGGHIAQVTEGYLPLNASIDEIKAYVREIVDGRKNQAVTAEDTSVIEGTVLAKLEESVLPDAVKRMSDPTSEDVSDVIFKQIAELDALFIKGKADARLEYVTIGGRGKRRHLLWDGKVVCNKPGVPSRVKPSAQSTNFNWCKHCCARVASGKPLVGGESTSSLCDAPAASSDVQLVAEQG